MLGSLGKKMSGGKTMNHCEEHGIPVYFFCEICPVCRDHKSRGLKK